MAIQAPLLKGGSQISNMDSCSENTNSTETISVPNFVLLSFTFNQLPFLKPLYKLKPSLPTPLCDLRDSVSSTADKGFRFLHLLASQNPFLHQILNFASELKRFNQICYRNYRNVNSLPSHNFAAVLPGDSMAGLVVANGISNFLNLYNTLLVVRLVLTWFPNSPPAIVSPLSTLCDPYLNIFRGLIPPLGGTLDLSPILAFLVLNAFTSTAAALPAELPVQGASQKNRLSTHMFSHLTISQKKWMRRLSGNHSENSKDGN